MALTVMAPVLIIGLNGRFDPFCSSIELKTSPLGSTLTRRSTSSAPISSTARPNANGFEIDWMVNG